MAARKYQKMLNAVMPAAATTQLVAFDGANTLAKLDDWGFVARCPVLCFKFGE